MSLRRLIFVALICIASANLAYAQPRPTSERLTRVTYPVADLIAPIKDHTAFPERKTQKEPPAATPDSIARQLRDLITGTIAKDTWEEMGGVGSIQYFPLGGALVVNQTPKVQEEVAQLLTALRRMQEVQVSIVSRLILVEQKMADQLLKEMEKHGKPLLAVRVQSDMAHKAKQSVSLDEKRTVKILELVQGHRDSTVMQLVKMTLHNGQRAGLDGAMALAAGEIGAGVRCDFHPVVDADRENVRLGLDFESVITSTHAEGIRHRQTINAVATFVVPAGQTLIWHLGKTATQDQMFLLATPRLLIAKDNEGIFLGTIPPIPGR